MKIYSLLVFLQVTILILAYKDCGGQYNEQPLLHPKTQLLDTIKNGQKYLISSDSENFVYVVNVTGTPYQMGLAYGTLLKDEVNDNYKNFVNYGLDSLNQVLKDYKVPAFIRHMLDKKLLPAADYLLQLNYNIALPYIPKRWIDEMQGVADGSGITFQNVVNVQMIPELIKASCTIAGTWSKATVGNKLLSLRALDWMADAPMNKYPLIALYHSTEQGSFPFANIGYTGLIGALTAFGSQGVTVSEKVWIPRYNKQDYPTTYVGKPWSFVTRDLAQFGTTIQQMADTLQNTDRTCRIHIGMASEMSNGYEGVDYSWKVIEFFNDQNFTDYGPWHPQLEGVQYFDKYIQPSENYCVGSILQENWGKIDWETLYRGVGGYSKTGDSQLCAMDVQEKVIYLSYSTYNKKVVAYEKSPMYIDLKPFFE